MSPWVTYAASQTGASLDVQNAIVAGVATLSGGVAAGLAGANAQAGATFAENEALNNTLQHRDQVIAAIQKTLAANPTLASQYSVDTLEHAAENVYGGNGGMGVWKNEADARAATAKDGTTYYQNAQGLYVEQWNVPAGAEDVARNIVDNALYEYGPSFAAVTKDNLSQLMSTYLKTFGSDPSQFQGVAEAAGGGALFGIGATSNLKSGVPGDDFTPNANITTPYSRPSGAGPTAAQRTAVAGQPCVDCGAVTDNQVADHIDPLVVQYYRDGAVDVSAQRCIDAVQPHCPTCSAIQGGQLGAFGRAMKNFFGF